MKFLLPIFTLLLTFCTNIVFAQPPNDNYINATDVSSIINSCSVDAAYTTLSATMDKSQGSCNNGSGYNVWFKFQATATTMNVKIDRGGPKGTIRSANIAIWQADGTTQIACNRYVGTYDDVEIAAIGLTIGQWYYISIDNNSIYYRGTFTLCLNTTPNYDFYEGAIDVSALINSCSPDEAYTTVGGTMDKSQGSCNNGSGFNRWFKFQATATTMNVKIDRGGTKGTIRSANLAIWQADGTTQLACNRYVGTYDDVEVAAIGLTIGQWYYISIDNNSIYYRGTFTLCLNTTPNYDFYEGAIDVSAFINSCSPDAAYTTIGATMDKSQGSCNNGSGYNRWFKFQATTTTVNVKIDRGGAKGSMRRANLAIWQADGSTQMACNRYVGNDDDVETSAFGLTIGQWYYISVDNNYLYYRGTFTLCLNTTVNYDFYEGAIDVSAFINSCSPDAAYTTIGATMDKAQGSCNNGSGYNRWFKFQATSTVMNVKIDRGGAKGSIRRVNLAIWQADGTTEVACNKYVGNDDDVEIAAFGLTIGQWYYISVDNNYLYYKGTFTLCLNTNVSYDFYEGAIDVSAFINSCSPDAAYSTVGGTMDKSQGSCNNGSGYNRWFKFQATATVMNVKIERGGAKGSIRRVNLAVWQADGTTEITCNRYVGNDDDVEIAAIGLTIGQWYYISVDNNYSYYKGTFTLCLNTTPSYDFYEGAIDISAFINSCSPDAAYTTSGATMDKSQGSCNNGSGYNRWFKFQATQHVLDLSVQRGGSKGTIKRINVALWQSDGVSELACAKYSSDNDIITLSYPGLTIGNWYYISVDNNYNYFRGTFTLCIDNSPLKYYSRSSGNWNSNSSWSLIDHAGVSAGSIPSSLDDALIDGHSITVNSSQSCIGLNLTNNNGAPTLTIDNAGLTVSKDILNNGQITVQNNGALVQTTSAADGNSGSGTYTIKRTGNSSVNSFNIWSSPIQNATILTVFSGANPCDIFTFDNNLQSWKYDFTSGFSTSCNGNAVTFGATDVISGGDGVMDVSRGYYIPGNVSPTKNFNGTINNGTLTIPIKNTVLGNQPLWNDDDWNLVGNPYPSSINATTFWNENAVNHSRITDAIYYWDDKGVGSGYNQNSDYASWNLMGGVNSGNSAIIPNGFISSGQGFWVVASATTNLVFNNSMRAATNNQFFKTDNNNTYHNIWISLTSPSAFQNNILVGYNNSSTDAHDNGYDAHKLIGNYNIRLASYIDTNEYVIQAIAPPELNETKTIPLLVYTTEYGDHKFKEYKRENLPANVIVYLRDNYLGLNHDLSQGDYVVTLNPNIEYKARFTLVIKNTISNNNGGSGTKGGNGGKDSTVTSVSENIKSGFLLIQNQEELVISNQNGLQGNILIYDISGKLLCTKEGVENSTSQTISWSSFNAGAYFITINNGAERLFLKQVVKP